MMVDEHRRKAEALLREAIATTNMVRRSDLISQASYWHTRALVASGQIDDGFDIVAPRGDASH